MQTSGPSAVLILSIVILLQLHILNDIYLNCFNIKERKEARVRGMVTEWTNLMGNKSSRKVGSEPVTVRV
jgi:ribulose 1,5-bisphosphate synthetase/thiazole synthase